MCRSHGCPLLSGEPPKFAFISVPVGHGAEGRGCPGAGAPMGGTPCTAAPEDPSPEGRHGEQRPRGLSALQLGLWS